MFTNTTFNVHIILPLYKDRSTVYTVTAQNLRRKTYEKITKRRFSQGSFYRETSLRQASRRRQLEKAYFKHFIDSLILTSAQTVIATNVVRITAYNIISSLLSSLTLALTLP